MNKLYLTTSGIVASIIFTLGCDAKAPSNTVSDTIESQQRVIDEKKVMLNYLYKIQGSKTILGIHNDEKTDIDRPSQWSEQLTAITGEAPGLWSYDIGYNVKGLERRPFFVSEAEKYWRQGKIVNLMMHVCPPSTSEPCNWKGEDAVLSDLSQEQWKDLLSDTGELNRIWKTRLDQMAVPMQQLQDKGVRILFRPFHEMNQTLFWWSLAGYPEYTAELYRQTHRYLVQEKQLSNLTFQWNVQDFATLAEDLNSYDPGSEYWDILSLDNYDSDGTGYSQEKYELMVAKANGKPISLGEVSILPSPRVIEEQPLWTFIMGWSQLTFSDNSIEDIKDLAEAENIIMLKDMPGWENRQD